MKRRKLIVRLTALAAVVVTCAIAPSAAAYDTPPRLNDVARLYSLGVGEVRCDSDREWNADGASRFAWSYTNVRHDYSVLPPFLCEGALNVGSATVPLWQRAAGTWTLVREAFHLRHWRYRRNEAKVLCQAIVYFTEAATRLGATEAQANELYPMRWRCIARPRISTHGSAIQHASCRRGSSRRGPSQSGRSVEIGHPAERSFEGGARPRGEHLGDPSVELLQDLLGYRPELPCTLCEEDQRRASVGGVGAALDETVSLERPQSVGHHLLGHSR